MQRNRSMIAAHDSHVIKRVNRLIFYWAAKVYWCALTLRTLVLWMARLRKFCAVFLLEDTLTKGLNARFDVHNYVPLTSPHFVTIQVTLVTDLSEEAQFETGLSLVETTLSTH